MADITFTAAGVPLTISKSADGSLYAYSNSFPGVGVPAGEPGNFASGPLTSGNLSQGIQGQQSFIADERARISQAQRELTILQTNPASILGVNYSPSSLQFAINQQRQIIEGATTRIAGAERVIAALTQLNQNIVQITTQFSAANPAAAGASFPEAVPPPDQTTVQNQEPGNATDGNNNAPIDPNTDPALATPNEEDDLGTPLTEPPLGDEDGFDDPIDEDPPDTLTEPPFGDEDVFTDEEFEFEEGLQEPPLGDEDFFTDEDEVEFDGGLQEPPIGDEEAFDEFAGLDEAVEQQKQIAINTSGLPVIAEDGSVVEGILRNPETGELYSAETPNIGPDAPFAEGSSKSIDANKTSAQEQATAQDSTQFKARQDWRVRLSLSPGANYLYKANPPGILSPLAETDGVIFPYTPTVSVTYSANYDPTHPTHSNYKIFQYTNSAVDSISITGDFTAQDTREANYLLAVIHFFRSITKMFYGQDENPKPGTPPPLCYLFGMGAFQFDAHPLAITNFTYSLPNDVDYIKANISYGNPGVNRQASNSPNNTNNASAARLGSRIQQGGNPPPPQFSTNGTNTPSGSVEPTYVPTKIQLSISAVPVISRNQISNEFSLTKYATGQLMRGTKRSGGGIW